MPVTDIDSQLERYRHKKYRKRRIRFYGLVTLSTVLLTIILGLAVISMQPIDVSNIKGADNALTVVQEEYGETYIRKLDNLPTIAYETQYQTLKDSYVGLVKDGGDVKDKDKLAVDLVAFVEYVEVDAVKTAEQYSMKASSKEFYQRHLDYQEEHGDVHETLVVLVDSHRKLLEKTSEEELLTIISGLDERMVMYTDYLTSLKKA